MLEDLKNKKLFRVAIGILILVILIAAFFVIYYFKFLKKEKETPQAEPFANCQKVKDNCNSPACSYFYLCNKPAIAECEIYNCGGTLGALIKDIYGKQFLNEQEKIDQNKIVPAKETDCGGEGEILEKKCENNQEKDLIKVSTKGECEIVGFFAKIGQSNQKVNFQKTEEGNYLLTFNTCKDISNISAIGKNGAIIPIK
ncbi:MAG: hypothetical protein HY764_01735 [Candidatus Portnoybacteria bacterium]|nr:hypothetical protein [Candidatus Portnoybacteria bacterium]